MKKLILASLIAPLMLIASCGSAVPSPEQKTSADPSAEPSAEPEKKAPEIVLTAPENDVEITLTRGGETEFRWDKISGQAFYNILFSAYKTMVNATQVEVRANHITFSGSELGDIAESLGIAKGETKDLYWSVIPWAEGVKYTPQVRCIKLTN
ncbi:MAG: SusE domain-containing protein, partial [Bacteroidales bacterium]|nr:SusE domain-containing protein [Bacteroidales bacterium]